MSKQEFDRQVKNIVTAIELRIIDRTKGFKLLADVIRQYYQ